MHADSSTVRFIIEMIIELTLCPIRTLRRCAFLCAFTLSDVGFLSEMKNAFVVYWGLFARSFLKVKMSHDHMLVRHLERSGYNIRRRPSYIRSSNCNESLFVALRSDSNKRIPYIFESLLRCRRMFGILRSPKLHQQVQHQNKQYHSSARERTNINTSRPSKKNHSFVKQNSVLKK